ncbi:hypothetical protein ANN_20562 [Periplaneta americana]|uniref:Uncharacterized protein n=1 Tax=Periplaneta americana TaxID=6978 RepID=A0ABQ8SCY0_PERAM|nr:hypothetical protein ANN_20562 [Periplaneta americana]
MTGLCEGGNEPPTPKVTQHFAHIGLRENPGKNLNQVTCPDRDSNPGHLVSQPDALTVTPQVGYDGRDWINLAQDRDRWRAYVRAAMNLRVP